MNYFKINLLFTKTISLVLIFFLSSCATDIDFRMPANRFQGPESLGKTLRLRGDFNYKSGHKVNLAEVSRRDIFSDNVDVNDESSIDRSRGIGVDGRLGIFEDLDLFYSVSADAPSIYGLKYQFLGNDGEDGLKFAFGAGYGSGKEDKIVSIAQTDFSVDLNLVSYETFLSVGFRRNEFIMGYLTAYYSEYSIEASLDPRDSNVTRLDINSYSRSSGVMMGLELSNGKRGNRKILTVEGGYALGKYKGLKETGDFVYGVSLGGSY